MAIPARATPPKNILLDMTLGVVPHRLGSRSRTRYVRRISVGCALTLTFALHACGGPTEPGAASCSGSSRWTHAARLEGRVATVRGPVAGTSYRPDVNGAPTFINVGADYPDDSRFTVIIWGADRSKFPDSPESTYDGVKLCVRGFVTIYRGVPEIEVRDPDAMQAID
jgi:hypothetical protein